MIKNFIHRLLGKGGKDAPVAAELPPTGRRVEVPREVHRIDPKLIDERAVRVVTTLQDAGFEAYIVGGAVRDLLLGHRPKDFDVATNATPEQVKGLFRRAFIIGRRFRIVHVVHGRGRDHEVIEVSTFRAYLDPSAAEQLVGNEKPGKSDLASKSHVVDASGRVLRDNVWGPQDEDAARRDFTVNALYYDPRRELVIDYHRGIEDSRLRLLRMIGDPETRYREDPVRMIRVVRFAAKLGFEIEAATRAPLVRMADLLGNVPASRLFDEMIKLLQTGHSLASLEELRKQGLHRGVFPILDAVLDDAHRHDGREKFIHMALSDTDRRVGEGKPVAPSFMLACMLWHEVLRRRDDRRSRGESPTVALQQATDAVFDARIGDISGRGKLAADMREIWMMQPRFERRTPSAALSLVAQPRFRAGFDFLRLRADAGELDEALARWWEAFSLADDQEREDLLEEARQADQAARRQTQGRPGARTPAAAGRPVAADRVSAPAEASADDEDDDIEPSGDEAAAPAPARRKRRRRKPAGAGAGAAGGGAGGSQGT
ncbi:poly(A) polymerase [Sphaerotilus hippei]|uniref:Poly(A) polymerase I n=1 Tax=Sphaerotilus hippei TaxID=744406 RepID=A0A318GX28_9BURK|nr:polynucleotide adenylyltransferase PcnB [Sphaerotilus hippei]PXW94179.1 poly(A) polymerase [Sphaerotilus hippei]